MKVYLLIVVAVVLAYVVLSGGQQVYAQETSPAETPVVEPAPEEEPPAEPTPIPPTMLELILEMIQELGGWLTGLITISVAALQKGSVSRVRSWFPNDEKTATRINGGMAQIFAGITAVALTLVGFGVTWLTGYVSSVDVLSIVALATALFGGGELMHKAGKLSKFARLLTVMTKA